MLKEKLKDHRVILSSGSPRRQRFFKELDLVFTIDVRSVEEVYSDQLKGTEITDFLAKKKAEPFTNLKEKDILVTSDTIVWFNGKPIEKAANREEAIIMLQTLSKQCHKVHTSVCFTTQNTQKVVHDTTLVWFKELSKQEIEHYVDYYEPYDKAGSYGIQDWLGYIGVEKIQGCFFNVMGLPTRLVFKELMAIAQNAS